MFEQNMAMDAMTEPTLSEKLKAFKKKRLEKEFKRVAPKKAKRLTAKPVMKAIKVEEEL